MSDRLVEQIRENDELSPKMNYRYPVRLRDSTAGVAQAKLFLARLPLVIVHGPDFGDYYLALTGGGMDLSAEIARAYMALGHLPPVHFQPPQMANEYETEEQREVLYAYLLSCCIQKQRVERSIATVTAMLQGSKK